MIRTVFIALWIVVITLVIAPVCAFLSVFWAQSGAFIHLLSRFWARTILLVSGVNVVVQGVAGIDRDETYVYMANHQSMYDIFVLFAHLPFQFRWLAKKELFRIPVMGYAMGKVGHISIDRSDRRSAHKSLIEAARKIAEGASVVIFPEGSRSRDGAIMPFKPGGFHLAVRSGRPIVPLVISGTREVMRKGRIRVSPGHVTISLNPPVDVHAYKKNKKALMDSVHSLMKQDLERVRANTTDGSLNHE